MSEDLGIAIAIDSGALRIPAHILEESSRRTLEIADVNVVLIVAVVHVSRL